MAKIKVGDKVAVDGLSNAAATAAIKEIGADRLKLAKAGNTKALREIKEIAAKWAKKHPCDPDCAPGAAPKAEAAPKSKAAHKTGSKAAAPKSEPKPKAPKAEASPKSKAAPKEATPSKATPKAKAETAPTSKAAPKSASKPRSESKPTSESKPKSVSKPKRGPKPKAERAPKTPKPKTAKAKEPNVTEEKVKELRTKLAAELGTLRVLCPEVKQNAVDDAAAALATARAVALVSPAVRKARNELLAALKGFAGYEAAKAAIAAAEKSVPVQQAKAHVKAVLAEQLTENEQQIIEDAEKDPRVIAARKALADARAPEAVQKAQENLAAARDTCRRSARTLRETYGNVIDKVRADMAKQPPVVSDVPIVVPTAEELLFGSGPRTVASARAAS